MARKKATKAPVKKHHHHRAAPGGIIKYGLGSLTTNFDTISSLQSYQNFPPGGRPYPPGDCGFRTASRKLGGTASNRSRSICSMPLAMLKLQTRTSPASPRSE